MKKFFSLCMMCFVLIVAAPIAFAETALVAAPATIAIDLTGIAVAVLTCLCGVIFKTIYPLLNNAIGKALAMTACYAAEQLYKTGVIQDRLQYATNYLAEHGIVVNARELIEAAVCELNVAKSMAEDIEIIDEDDAVLNLETEEQSDPAE